MDTKKIHEQFVRVKNILFLLEIDRKHQQDTHRTKIAYSNEQGNPENRETQ